VVFKGLFGRFHKKEEASEQAPVLGMDGWVELSQGRLIVHDPREEGRYATLTPEPGVRLWVNEEEVTGPTVVTASDQIRFEVDVDPADFFTLHVSPDEMAVTLRITADPHRLCDTVALHGQNQVRLVPSSSAKARPRSANPKALILDRLRQLGIDERLIDEAAIERELQSPTGEEILIAAGREASPPVPGQWVWRLDEWSMAEAGQVIASYQGGQPNRPRITVMGKEQKIYEEIPEPQAYLAGNGTRLLPGGRLVASASGRARAMPSPQGLRVHIFPVEEVHGDLTTDLETEADLLVHGSIIGAKVKTKGEILVSGNVDRAELRAEVITIRGAVQESRLATVDPGHYLPLRAELKFMEGRIESMREMVAANKAIPEEAFRDVSNLIRAMRRKAEQIGITHPDWLAVAEDVAKVFLSAQTTAGFDLPTAGRLLLALNKLTKAADQLSSAPRSISVRSISAVTAWAARDINIAEKAGSATLLAGGQIKTPEEAVLTQVELVAAGGAELGVLSTVRGSAPVMIRTGGRLEIAEAQVGTVIEFGADHKEFKADLLKVAVGINARGQLLIRQRD
jgi:hypothetical protein